MREKRNENRCILGIAPSSRGFGYAVMTKKNVLVDWGVKSVKSGKKNERCLSHAAKLIEEFEPEIISLEDLSKSVRGSRRTQELIQEVAALAQENQTKAMFFSRKQVNLKILRDENGTKHQIATNLAHRYREQLSFRLPAKRRVWQSEPYQMDIFAAVALAQCAQAERGSP